MNYRITLQYDGTRYDGWQRQGNTERTIQGKLEAVLSRMAESPVEVNRPPEEVSAYLNRYLPEDIRVLSAETAAERFHSRLNAQSKTYRYQVWTDGKADVFLRSYVYALGQPLNVPAMEQAAKRLVGTHDFKSFCGNRKMKKSTVRTITAIHFLKLSGGKALAMDFTGNGFLQQMVRILAGTLIEVGLGKRTPESVEQALLALDRSEAGFTAPPEGLCLMEVRYGGE